MIVLYKKLLDYIDNEKELLFKDVMDIKNNFKNKLGYNYLINSYWFDNIRTLRVGYFKPIGNDIAKYYMYNNIIKVKNRKYKNLLYHEFFHMISTKVVGKNIYSGFQQFENGRIIGFGLNEGYTELLTQRYFGYIYENSSFEKTYPVEVHIALMLEKIVGISMEKMYKIADQKALVDYLSRYADCKDIEKFILMIDEINLSMKNYCDFETIIPFLICIDHFLLEWYTNYQKVLLGENKINRSEYSKNISDYLKELNSFYSFCECNKTKIII